MAVEKGSSSIRRETVLLLAELDLEEQKRVELEEKQILEK